MISPRSSTAALALALCSLCAQADEKQQRLQSDLFQACSQGSLEQVQKLLSQGANASLMAEDYRTLPLHEAIGQGHQDIVKLLVRHGGPLNEPSALAVAAWGVPRTYSERDTKSMIDLLLSLGADVHANDDEAMTAASRTALAVVQHLVKAGGKPTREALESAVIACHLDIVEHLVKAGIDPVSTDSDGRTLLHDAAAKEMWGYWKSKPEDRLVLWNRLVSLGVAVNARDRNGRSPLFDAATKEMTAWLIQQKAEVNLKDNNGMTALMAAAGAEGGHTTGIMRLLFKAGAGVMAKDHHGKTAFDYAAAVESWEEMSVLLDAGAVPADAAGVFTNMARATLDHATTHEHITGITGRLLPHVRDLRALSVDGVPLVSWAVLLNNQVVAQLLLKAGADVNAADAEGRTPLMLAAMTKNGAMSKLLTKAGADSERKSKRGFTAKDLAWRAPATTDLASSGDSDASPAPVSSAKQDDLFQAIADNRFEDVKRLVAGNSRILAQTRGGIQPLHLAVALGHRPMVEWLLSHGTSLTVKTSDLSSCLAVAVAAGQLELARWLLDQAGIIDRTALMKELHQLWSADGSHPALWLALEAGWKPEDKDEGLEAVELAVQYDDLATTRQLLSLGAPLTPAKANTGDPFMGNMSRNLILLASQHSTTKLLSFLLEKTAAQREEWKADITEALHSSIESDDLPTVKLLVERGAADVNAVREESPGLLQSRDDKAMPLTPICLAVAHSHREIAEYLIQKGAKLAGHDRAGRQVLASAVATREIEMVRLMLDHGAALEATDNEDRTALHEAASRGLTDITALLISKGANRDAKDKNDRTPAQLAESEGHPLP